MNIPKDKPWMEFWPEGIPRHLEYPEIPLHRFLTDSAEKYPDNVAFSHDGNSITFKDLEKNTNQLASALSGLGLRQKGSAVVFLPNGIDYVTGYYGILKSGAAVAPANPTYKKDEIRHQITDSRASCVICNRETYPVVKEVREETGLKGVIVTDAEDIPGTISLRTILVEYPSAAPDITINPKVDIAAIEYTGGTTGLPKGAMLTHYNLVANAIQNATYLSWTDKDVIVGLLPFYHSWGACTCVNSPIYAGAKVVTMPRYDAETLLSSIEKDRVTLLHGAASLYTMLINTPGIENYDLSSLRYVKAGAMPIPPEIRDKWEQITGVKMILAYGLSEASPETHTSPPDRVKPGTIGIPIMDTDAKIVDEETGIKELPPNEIGELIIRGPQVMAGYLNRPEENRSTLRNGWLYTGDLAKMDEEGYFYIVDRKKEIIKYKGYTIAPAEVEAALYEHPSVKECAVVGVPDDIAGELPKAYVVLKEDCEPCADELIDFCKDRLSPYKRVRLVEFIDEIPKTQVGKILRRILRDRKE
ncbi:MAG: long-chain fatty acid--CoA ligase [Dehalococcoidales bacterium]|nr:long-chain fatty acid--CoA ligase [Dehalococcoidales bacterium]